MLFKSLLCGLAVAALAAGPVSAGGFGGYTATNLNIGGNIGLKKQTGGFNAHL